MARAGGGTPGARGGDARRRSSSRMRTRPRRTRLSSRRGQRTAESASPATARFAHTPTSRPPPRTRAGRRPSALRPTPSSAHRAASGTSGRSPIQSRQVTVLRCESDRATAPPAGDRDLKACGETWPICVGCRVTYLPACGSGTGGGFGFATSIDGYGSCCPVHGTSGGTALTSYSTRDRRPCSLAGCGGSAGDIVAVLGCGSSNEGCGGRLASWSGFRLWVGRV
jgi:hypothetical protein